MAMNNRYIEVWHNNYYSLDVWCRFEQNIDNNTTTVTVTGVAISSKDSLHGFNAVNCQLGIGVGNKRGALQTISVSIPAGTKQKWYQLTNAVSYVVNHNEDGTSSGTYVYGYINTQIQGYDNPYNIGWQSAKTGVFDTIPRASTLSLNDVTEVSFGNNISVNISHKSNTFYYKRGYRFGNNDTTYIDSVGKKCNTETTTEIFNIPISEAVNIPSSFSGQWNLIVQTYSDEVCVNKIGLEQSVQVMLVVPNYTLTSPTCIATKTDAFLDEYVQGRSALTLSSPSFTGNNYYSNVEYYAEFFITNDGNTTQIGSRIGPFTDTIVSPIFSLSGIISYKIYLKDSRGYGSDNSVVGTFSNVGTVYSYTAPLLSGIQAKRCDSSGNLDENGTSVKFFLTANIAPINSKNKMTLKIYLGTDANSLLLTTAVNDVARSYYSGNYIFYNSLPISNSANYYVLLSDSIGNSTSYIVTVGPSFKLMNINAAKTGISFGKKADVNSDYFEVNMKTKFLNTSMFNEQANFSNGLSITGTATVGGNNILTSDLIINNLTTESSTSVLSAAQGKILNDKIAPVILYENTSGTTGTITNLPDNIDNYTYIGIVYGQSTSTGDYIKYIKLYKPNGCRISLDMSYFDNASNTNSIYIQYKTISISGNSVSVIGEAWSRIRNNLGTLTTGTYTKIYRVEGWK